MKFDWIKKILSYQLTLMIVPHGSSRPRQINIHLSMILLITFTWATITFWGTYLSAQHVDYWRTEVTNQAMKMKIKYLLAQMDKSREYLDEVKTVDAQLRDLLQYQNQTAVITNEKPPQEIKSQSADGTGGPTMVDANNLARIMQSVGPDISWPTLIQKVGSMKTEAQDRLKSFDDLSDWIDTQRRLFRATPRGWPYQGPLTSKYGERNSPFNGSFEFHPGIDIKGPHGAPVRATADGVVRLASWNGGYGNLVLIQHEFGFSTRYAHNSRLLVKPGEKVKRGQIIALMGTTGKSSGVHCHYEVWRYNIRKNPISYLREDQKFAGKPPRTSLH
ncbi:MAG: hypothetical protein KCHDKBKB_02702 [Elusimicrobia bacterium]|nr:hypothetical protein [Elusimicrobiota bacterium]